jgi:ABC-2 type transport system permease protein
MFGLLRRMDTVAGYTAYKSGFFIAILGAIWGLFMATRVSRGEEDAGRWEIYLSGHTTHARAAAHVTAGLGVSLVALWVPMAILSVAAGSSDRVGIGAGASIFFVTACVASVAMFMAIGLLSGQIAASRHDANMLGAGVLAGSYLVRMVADSDPALGWLRWASPIGWFEELHPLTGSRAIAFVPIVGLVVVCVAGALVIAARRDLGDGAFRSRDAARARTLLLGGQAGLTVRLTRRSVIAWLSAFAVVGLFFGLVMQAAGNALQGSPTLERVIQRLGADRAGAAAYLGFVFVMAAGLVAIAVAGQISAIRNEESSGHLDNLVVRRVARWRWLSVRTAIAAGLVLTASLLVGLTAWLGASGRGVVPFGDLVQAGVNAAPPALFILGVSVLVFGVAPRAAIGVAYGLVVWSFFVETIASIFDSNHWLRDTSPLLHMAPAPAAAPDWTSAAWLVGLGLAAAAAGVIAFERRDVAGA